MPTKITVTKNDLEQALEYRGDSTIDNTCYCILAIAAKRQILNAFSVGFYSVHSREGASIGEFEQRADCYRLTAAFDERRYDDVRSMLPLTLTFHPDLGK